MELKEYVSQTIVQITEGILDAMEKLGDKDVIINPDSTFHSDGKFWIGKNNERGPVERWVQSIEMNISTTVSESSEGKGGAKVSIGVLNIGAGIKDRGAEQSANTVKFSIPVCFPCTKVKK